ELKTPCAGLLFFPAPEEFAQYRRGVSARSRHSGYPRPRLLGSLADGGRLLSCLPEARARGRSPSRGSRFSARSSSGVLTAGRSAGGRLVGRAGYSRYPTRPIMVVRSSDADAELALGVRTNKRRQSLGC